jgi:hypothetical protein
MKTLLTIFTLVFTLMFSSTSFAEWTKVSDSADGDTHYVDFERMRKVDGYVYYWVVTDLLKPDKDGDFSYKAYIQGDCKLFRVKYLSTSYHKEPMGGGTGQTFKVNLEWV